MLSAHVLDEQGDRVVCRFGSREDAAAFLAQCPQPEEPQAVLDVYTDGSCPNNGKANAGPMSVGAWFGDHDPRNISETLHGVPNPTNQRAELFAILRSLEQPVDEQVALVRVFSDSRYAVDCCTRYIRTWARNGWKLKGGGAVKNQDVLRAVQHQLERPRTHRVEFKHVSGHSGVVGNERAHRLATRSGEAR